MREQRREPGGARALDHGLLDLQQQRDRLLQIAFADQHDVVDQRRDDPQVISPGSLTAMPSASVSPAHGRSVPLMRLYIDGIQLGLDADHLDRAESLAPRSHARDQPAAADRDASVSISGTSSSISSATVPWPAMSADRRTDGRRSGRARLQPRACA